MRYLHIAPCYQTTGGHKQIHRCIQQAVSLIDPTDRVSLVLSQHDNALDDDKTPTTVIIDFPDASWWLVLVELMHIRPKWHFVYLSMVLDLEYLRSQTKIPLIPNYDVVISLELGAIRLRKGPSDTILTADADATIAPLVEAVPHYSHFEERITGLPEAYNIIVTSGFDSEIKWLTEHAERITNRTGRPTYPLNLFRRGFSGTMARRTISLCASPRVKAIYTPYGYSTFWELYLLGVAGKCTWMKTHRPIENLEGRLRLLTPAKSEILASSRAGQQLDRSRTSGTVGQVDPIGINQLAGILKDMR